MRRSIAAVLALALASLAGACSKTTEVPAASEHHAGSSPSRGSAITAPSPPPPPEEAHGDHGARHGGIVIMDGNQQHFEILLGQKDGQHRVHFSTSGRRVLPASAMDQVRLTITHPDGTVEDLPMTRDATDAFWQVGGKPLASPETRIKVAYGGKGAPPYQFELTLAGFLASAVPPAPAGHDGHKHAH